MRVHVEACGCKYETTIERVYKLGQHGWDHVTSTWVPCEAHRLGLSKLPGTSLVVSVPPRPEMSGDADGIEWELD